jgi:hypothetical protein
MPHAVVEFTTETEAHRPSVSSPGSRFKAGCLKHMRNTQLKHKRGQMVVTGSSFTRSRRSRSSVLDSDKPTMTLWQDRPWWTRQTNNALQRREGTEKSVCVRFQ